MAGVSSVSGLHVDLTASSAKFTGAMVKARASVTSNAARMNKAFAGLDRGIGKAQSSMLRYAKSVVSVRGAVATLVGGAGIGLLIKRSLDAADAIAKQSNALGFTTKALQELSFAAGQSGVATSLLQSSLTVFVKRMGEAKAATGPLISGLKGLDGALLADLSAARNMDEAFNVLIRGLEGASSAADRARIANAAFGRSGIQMVNVVENGAASFDDMRRQANSLGLVIRDDLIRNAVEAKDQLAILGRALSTQVTSAVLELSPAIADLSQRFIDGLPTLVKYVDKLLQFFDLIDKSPTQRLADLQDKLAGVNEEFDSVTKGFGPNGPVKIFGSETPMAEVIRDLKNKRVILKAQIEGVLNELERINDLASGGTSPGRALPTTPGRAPAPSGPTARARPRLKPPTIDIIAERNSKSLNALMDRFKQDRDNAVAAQQKLGAAAARVFADTRTPMEDYQARLVTLNELADKGAVDQFTYARAVAQAQDELQQAAIAGNRFAAAGQEMGRTLATSLDSVILRAETAKDAMRGLVFEVQRLVLQAAVTGPLQSFLGDALGGLFAASAAGKGGPTASSIKKLKGFAHGGSFTVGGPGGVDKTRVEFAATRGEKVTVTPPGRAAGGGTQVINIDARGAEAGVERRIMAVLQQLSASIEPRAVAAVVDKRARNPALFGGAGA